MDPITAAIVGALGKLGENVIKDAYTALKAAIAHKCGVESEVVKAIENLEEKPNSTGRKETLKEELADAKVEKDLQIVEIAQDLLDKLTEFEAKNSSSTIIQQQAGDNATQIGQVGGDVNIKR